MFGNEIKKFVIDKFRNKNDIDSLCREIGILDTFMGNTDIQITEILNKMETDYFNHHEKLYNALFKIMPSLTQVITNLFKKEIPYDQDDLDFKKKILLDIERASGVLRNWKKNLSGVNYHIKREETDKLFSWINSKDNNSMESGKIGKNIAVLTGEAGSGKTVVLTDLLEKLINNNIITLGIKADLYEFNPKFNLAQKLGISQDIVTYFSGICNRYGQAVILIDQIDSLSLSMGKERDMISFYFTLISRLSTTIPQLKIIISTRTFDLEYDPVLSNFKDKFIVKMKQLKISDLDITLSKLNTNRNKIGEQTYHFLLQRPLYLDLYCIVKKEIEDTCAPANLSGLYDLLWEKKISKIVDGNFKKDVVSTLKEIVETMDSMKSLSIPGKKITQSQVIDYLKKESLISNNLRKITFFHTTFFDYCFARFFTEMHESLFEYVTNQHQGLFIRSQVKQVFIYLKEMDKDQYIIELKKILTNEQIKYHLKLLVINLHGHFEDITSEEKNMITNLLKNDSEFKQIFIGSIRSKNWFIYLYDTGYFQSFFDENEKYLNNIIPGIVSNFLTEYPEKVFDFFINNCKRFKDSIFVNSIFRENKEWNTKKAVEFIDKFRSYFKPVNKTGFYLLENIINSNPQKADEIFFKELNFLLENSKTDEDEYLRVQFPHEVNEIIEKLYSINPENTLYNVLNLTTKLIKKTEYRQTNNDKVYKADRAFLIYNHYDKKLYVHWKMLSYLIIKLKKIYLNNNDLYNELMHDCKNEKYISICLILFSCYSQKPELCKNDVLHYLNDRLFLEECGQNESLKFEVFKSIKRIFKHLTPDQRQKLLQTILSIKPNNENYNHEFKKSWFGLTKLEFLKAIPDDYISSYPEIEAEYKMLNRRYPQVKITKPGERLTFREVEAPLKNADYNKFNFKQWLSSFKKYSTERTMTKDFMKGGILEHSRAFEKCVKNNPDKLYPLIIELGTMNDIKIDYFYHGLQGLVEAEYDPKKIGYLIKKYWKQDEKECKKYILRAIDKLAQKKYMNNELFEILKYYALNDTDPDKEIWLKEKENDTEYYGGDPFTYAINTVRGSAVWTMGNRLTEIDKYTTELFEIFNEIADKDESISVRCCLAVFLQNMIHFDRNKTYVILLKLLSSENPFIIAYSLESIRYLANEDSFPELIRYFDIILPFKRYNRDNEFIGKLLTFFYLKEFPESENLFNKGCETNNLIVTGAIQLSAELLNQSNTKFDREKLKNIFTSFMNRTEKNIISKYDWIFNDLKTSIFPDIKEGLIKYLQSKTFIHGRGHYFFQYLIKCVAYYPDECIELLEIYAELESKIPEGQYIGNESIQLLIEAYNQTGTLEKKEKAIDIFDSLLKKNELKFITNKILEDNDRV